VTYSYDRKAKENDFGEMQVGVFTLRFLKQHEAFAEPMAKLLEEAAKKYAATNILIPHKILVALTGKGAARAQAQYWPGSEPPTVQVAPKSFQDTNLVNTLIHELAHYFHDKVVPGGMSNPEVISRYNWATRQKRTQEGGQRDVLEGKRRLLDKQYFELQEERYIRKPLPRKGQVFEFDPYVEGTQYHVKGKIVGKEGRNVLVEIIDAPPRYIERQKMLYRNTGPLVVSEAASNITFVGVDPVKDKELREVEAERTATYTELHALEDKPDDRYEVQHHDWLPTTYARKKPVEYFAEMMTTFVLGHLKPEPSRWLLSVVKTGEAPEDMRIIYSYDRRTSAEPTPTQLALGKILPQVSQWLAHPHAGKGPLYAAYDALTDDEKELIAEDVRETFSEAHGGSTVMAYKIESNPHHGSVALTTKKPDHLKPEETVGYLVRAKDVLLHWGQEELSLGEDLIILKPDAKPLPFE
jgi:hypothetical protein